MMSLRPDQRPWELAKEEQRRNAPSASTSNIINMNHFTFRQDHDVVKKVKDLRSRLKKSDADGGALQVCQVSNGLNHLEGGAAVQACTNLIHHHDQARSHHHLT